MNDLIAGEDEADVTKHARAASRLTIASHCIIKRDDINIQRRE